MCQKVLIYYQKELVLNLISHIYMIHKEAWITPTPTPESMYFLLLKVGKRVI